MVKLTFMTIIKFQIDTDTQETKILARYTNPIEGTTKAVAKKGGKKAPSVELGQSKIIG